jgi:membrane protein
MPGPEPPRPAEDIPARAGLGWPSWVLRLRESTWRVVVTTVGASMRHRVTGLAAEAAFFTVLSVPPLVFALAGAIG